METKEEAESPGRTGQGSGRASVMFDIGVRQEGGLTFVESVARQGWNSSLSNMTRKKEKVSSGSEIITTASLCSWSTFLLLSHSFFYIYFLFIFLICKLSGARKMPPLLSLESA